MRIAINGDVIDTKHIYKIHKIRTIEFTGWGKYDLYSCKFDIESFNKKFIEVKLPYDFSNVNSQTEFNIVKKDTEKKLSDFRDKIINIWLQNQSEIPQFNLNYE
ncbi:MAG: hypothetical protein ACOC3V_00380 [bacterium]